MNKPMHDRIYLLPEDGVWCWADRPAPGIGQSNDDAVEYVRADLFDQVVAQRDSFMSQLETLKTALDKDFQMLREHADRLHVENCETKRVNAELSAQVEAFKLIVVVHERELPHLVNKSKEDQFYLPLSIAMNTIVDAQELREKEILKIKADAGRAGFIAGFKLGTETPKPTAENCNPASMIDFVSYQLEKIAKIKADQYAERIRQGGEA